MNKTKNRNKTTKKIFNDSSRIPRELSKFLSSKIKYYQKCKNKNTLITPAKRIS